MRNKMIKISTRVMAAVLVAASVLSISTPVYAAENTAIVEEVAVNEVETVVEETPECEMTVPETEGQGDIIDDEFAVNEVDAWIASCKDRPTGVTQYVRTVVDPVVIAEEANGAEEAEEVEGQGDVIDDEFAVAPEAEVQPATESLILIEAPVIDVIMNEVEGQGDVIDDEFAYVEGQGDVIDDEFAVTPEAEAAVEAVEVAENDTEVAAASVKSFVAVGSADEAQKAEETKKPKDSVVVVFDPFNPIIPFKGVPTSNDSENKSDVVETVETVNKFLNPSDSVYGEPVRKVIDNCDVLGKDEKDYLKTCATLAIGSAEGLATGDYLPLWGAVKKVGKVSESLVKLHDSKTTNEVVANTIDVVTNTVEGVVCAIPGGGLVLNAYKSQMALGSYCFKKVCRFVNWLF